MRRPLLTCSLVAVVASGASVAMAQTAGGESQVAPAPRAEEPRGSPANAAPHAHFEAALVQYRAGRYRAAIESLNAAIALDPESKDLVYNLALVHEKLGELEEAVLALRRYIALEADSTEIQRAEQAIRRMEGAKAELTRAASAGSSAHPRERSAPAHWMAPAARATEESRLDSWFWTSSGVAAAAAIVGTVFGIRALVLQPSHDARTDEQTSIEDLRDQHARAQRSAQISDVSFALSLASGAAAALLWVGREPLAGEPGAPQRADSLGLSFGAAF